MVKAALASFIPQQQNKHKVQLQQLFLRRTGSFFLVPSRSCAFQVGVSCMQHSLTPPHPFNNPPSPPCYNDRSAVAVRQRQRQQQRLSMEECSSSGHSRAFVVWNVSVWKKACVYDGAIVCESQNHRGERVLARVCVCSSF